MSSIVVKNLVGGYSGKERYSIRQYPNGSFRAFHDNLYEGIGQDSNDDSVPLTGLHADIESVEAELVRLGLIQNST